MTIPAQLNLQQVSTPVESGYSCLAAILGTTVEAVADADIAGGATGSGMATLALRNGVYMRTVKDPVKLEVGFVYLVGRQFEGSRHMDIVVADLRDAEAPVVTDPQGLGHGGWLIGPDAIKDLRDLGDSVLVIRCLEISDPVRAIA